MPLRGSRLHFEFRHNVRDALLLYYQQVEGMTIEDAEHYVTKLELYIGKFADN